MNVICPEFVHGHLFLSRAKSTLVFCYKNEAKRLVFLVL
ncbi:hypothetical protein VSVS12_02713 [Vibrio scophthalmi]|nr:hypothetical protein VSVS12_02713 [Vibrio scophthalmi]